MARTLDELAAEALQLSVESRAALAKALLESLDELSPEEHENLWVSEAAERHQALLNGELGSSPAEEVFKRLEAQART